MSEDLKCVCGGNVAFVCDDYPVQGKPVENPTYYFECLECWIASPGLKDELKVRDIWEEIQKVYKENI